jgi:hypothetical protein
MDQLNNICHKLGLDELNKVPALQKVSKQVFQGMVTPA